MGCIFSLKFNKNLWGPCRILVKNAMWQTRKNARTSCFHYSWKKKIMTEWKNNYLLLVFGHYNYHSDSINLLIPKYHTHHMSNSNRKVEVLVESQWNPNRIKNKNKMKNVENVRYEKYIFSFSIFERFYVFSPRRDCQYLPTLN